MMQRRKTAFKLLPLVIALAYSLSAQSTVFAISVQQQKVLKKGIYYYDIETQQCTASPQTDEEVTPGTGSPRGTAFPNLDPEAMAKAIDLYIEKTNSNSKMNGLGSTIVASAKKSNINPFLIVTIAQKESGLSNPSDYNVSHGNNSFGRTATSSQPHFIGAKTWYSWTSVKASVDHTAPENSGKDDGDIASYLRNSGFYTEALNSNNLTKLMTTYAPPAENDTTGYVNDIKSWTSKLIALTNNQDSGSADTAGTEETEANTSSCGSCTDPSLNNDNALGKTVVIDPGHGPNNTATDQSTGLKMVETPNTNEKKAVWDVAQIVKTQLEAAGYNVILTKKSIDENITFRDRANVADDNNAALALSIHGDPGLGNSGEIYVQKVGLFRGSGSNKTTFSNATVAQKSQAYAAKFKTAREAAQGGSVVVKDNSFNGRNPLEPGNIPIVQLFSKTPWVYNEAKMPFNKENYAKGLVNGVKASLNDSGNDLANGQQDQSGCAGVTGEGLASTVLGYAWPEYHSPPYLTAKQAYTEAISKASAQGQYVGGLGHPGIDCGGFVTRLMIDSGYEPGYNYTGKISSGAGTTIAQEQWLKSNWQKINPSSTSDLQPGDVAVNSDHTYVYVGNIDGFNSKIASASVSFTGNGWRAPMAGHETPADPSFNWYRKK